MQYKKEPSVKLLKKCGLRKPSMYRKKQEKQTMIITQSRIKSQISDKSIKVRSPSRCKLCGTSGTNQLLNRFKELQQKYLQTLENTKQKNSIYQIQTKELQRLRACNQKDKKQIHRLRTMLGFIKRQDKGVQVQIEQISISCMGNKVQKSTDQQCVRQSRRQIETPKKVRSPYRQLQSCALQYCRLQNQSAKTLPHRQRISKNKRSPQPNYTSYQQNRQIDNNNNLKRSRKLDEPHNYNPEGCRYIRKTDKLSNSPYSKLRFVSSTKDLLQQ